MSAQVEETDGKVVYESDDVGCSAPISDGAYGIDGSRILLLQMVFVSCGRVDTG
jgi:hypothetical protein